MSAFAFYGIMSVLGVLALTALIVGIALLLKDRKP